MISYSRRNRDEALRIDEELRTAGHDVWIDREIEPAADWRERILRAIDACSTIVFLLSPDSLTSDVCAWEVARAVTSGKRIVPVVSVEPGDVAAPPEIASRNYIFMRSEAEWSAGFAKLLEAISVDLAWSDYHAKILLRAIEWDEAERRDRAMLRGAELDEAEQQFSVVRDPGHSQPTPLQLQYLQACRQAATQRLRRLIGIGAVALMVISGLAIVALVLRSQAIEEAAISRSGELAARADATADPYEAAVMAIEADAGRSTSSSRSALVRAAERLDVLPANRPFGPLLGHDGFVMVVDVSVAADVVVSGGSDENLIAWSLSTGEQIGGRHALGAEPAELAMSSAGERVAVTDFQGRLHLLDSKDLSPLEEPVQLDVVGSSIRWLDDDETLVVADLSGDVETWDVSTWERLDAGAVDPVEGLSAVDVSPDGSELAGVTSFGEVVVWSLDTGELTSGPTVVHGGIAYSVAWSPDGKRIASSSLDRTVVISDVMGQPLVAPMRGHEEGVLRVDWAPDGERLVSTGFDGTVRIWDAATGAPFGGPLLGHTNSVAMVAWADDGDTIASAGDDRSVLVWNVEPRDEVAEAAEMMQPVREVAWDGAAYWSAGDFAVVTRHDVDGESGGEIIIGDVPLVAMSVNPLDGRLAVLDQDGELTVVGSDGAQLATATLDSDVFDEDIDRLRPGAIAWSPDGTSIAVGLDFGVSMWRPGGNDDPRLLGVDTEGWIFTIDWSPDGSMLAIGGEDDLVHLWDIEGDVPVRTPLEFHIDDVFDVEWSPDGTRLATGSKDKSVRLWSTETWEPATNDLLGHRGWIIDVVWSPDGATLATSSPDRTVRFWETSSGSVLGDPLEGFEGFVTSIDWDVSGKYLVAGDDFGEVRTYRSVPTSELCRWAVNGAGEVGLGEIDLGTDDRSCTFEVSPTDTTSLPVVRVSGE